jgi:ligand-binding sensor domain-containing protein
MTRLKRCLLLVGLVLLLPGTAGSAQVQGPEEGWQVYTNANHVIDLTLEGGGALGGGYTWVATTGGVVCYSASEQVKFTTADGLVDNYVYAVAVDGGGRLWFGTCGGVSVLDHGDTPLDKDDDTWATFTWTAGGLADSGVHAIAADGGGRLWFGTSGGGVSVLDDRGTPFDKTDDAWITFTETDGLADNYVEAIAVDVGEQWWFGTRGGGVSVLDHSCTPFDKGDDTWATFTTADGLADNDVYAVAVDGKGWLWFGTDGGGVNVLDDGDTPFDKGDDTWATFTTTDGLVYNGVRAIAVDGGGRLWFGTYGGVSVLENGGTPFDKGDDTWATFTESDGLADNYIWAIAVDSGERSWFGTFRGGVSVLDHGATSFHNGDDTWASFTTADGLTDNQVNAVAVDGEGRLWFGTCRGVSVLDDGGTPFNKSDDTWATFTTADGLRDYCVWAIAVDEGERLWFSTGRGVSMLDHGGTPFNKGDDTWASFTTADGLTDNSVEPIAVDGGGRLWFGTFRGGVNVLNHGGTPFDKTDDTWTTFTESDSLADNHVYAIAVDGGGRLWFGTYGGVSALENGGTPFDKDDDTWTIFTESDDLADNCVRGIAVDSGGRLWFGTYGGVSVLDHGGTPFNKGDDTWTTFTTADGLADNHVHAIALDGLGRLWLGTCGGGVSVLNHGGTPFDKTDDTWVTFTTADGLAHNYIWAIAVDGGGRLWFGTYGGVSVLVYKACHVYLPIMLNWDPYYEDNDHWLDAYGPLICGQTYLAYPDDTEDYYYFVLSAPATVGVSVEDYAPTSSNGTVVLYGPVVGDEMGDLIDYYGPRGHSSMYLGPHSLGPGKYYVRVYTDQSHSTTQLYSLTVTY